MDEQLVKYFIEKTDEKFSKLDRRFDIVDQKLDLLFAFKWQIIGGSAILSFIVSVAVAIIATFANKT